MVSKRQGIIVVIVVIVLVAAGLVVMTGSNKNATNGGTNFVTDAMGRNISTDVSPQRIVSTSPAITTLVYALGAQDRLVAVDSYSDYPANVSERVTHSTLSVIGGFFDPNPESIVNASGSNNSSALVLLDSSVKSDVDMATQLSQFGIDYVFFYEGANTTQVYDNIRLGGKVLHESSNADLLVTKMQATLRGHRDLGRQSDQQAQGGVHGLLRLTEQRGRQPDVHQRHHHRRWRDQCLR